LKLGPWRIAASTVLVLTAVSYIHEIISRVPAYVSLHHQRPFYVAESIDKILGAAVCCFVVSFLYRTGLRGAIRQLGLSAPLLPAIVFALIASLPMLIGFAVTRSLTPHIQLIPLLFLTVLSPLVEEIEFRGFGVIQLQRGTGWSFWVVVWPSALLFGYVHIEQGQSVQEMSEIFLLLVAGGVTFAWLAYRWQNLWVAVALHICMNLWWEVFSVAKSAIGGWFPLMLQSVTMLLAIIITLLWKPAKMESAPSPV